MTSDTTENDSREAAPNRDVPERKADDDAGGSSDVFVLGAGFSKAIGNAMPVLQELAQAVLPDDDPARRKVREQFGLNLEQVLSYLALDHPWLPEAENLRNRALFLELAGDVGRLLNDRMRVVLATAPCTWIPGLLQSWHDRRAPVLTLNYDTLVERALGLVTSAKGTDRARVGSHDVWPVTLTPALQREAGVLGEKPIGSLSLIKLHGSVNWYYSGGRLTRGETIYFVPDSGWSASRGQIEDEHVRGVRDKVPLIVPPIAEKSVFFEHETVRRLWQIAAEALRHATGIFLIGYSLPPTDQTMRFLLASTCGGRAVRAFVVNPDTTVCARIGEAVPGITVDDRFAGKADCVARFAEALAKGGIL